MTPIYLEPKPLSYLHVYPGDSEVEGHNHHHNHNHHLVDSIHEAIKEDISRRQDDLYQPSLAPSTMPAAAAAPADVDLLDTAEDSSARIKYQTMLPAGQHQ